MPPAAGCAPASPTVLPAENTASTVPARTSTPLRSPTQTAPSATPTVRPTPTFTFTPTLTPTLAPDAWQSMPVVPAATQSARLIHRDGLGFGNDPHAFSILGDCLSLPTRFLGNFGRGPEYYTLGEHAYLQPVIEWFRGSYTRQSASLGNGFTTAAVLSPLRADRTRCEKGENPMQCEYRIHRPVIALIALGTDDYRTTPEIYEQRMRQIVEYTVSSGILPILATKADNREGNHAFNRIVASLAYEYGLPMWNFWLAVQDLPNHGLADNRGHLTWADPDDFSTAISRQRGTSVRSLTFLQSLDSVWRGVTAV
ncbi:MAG: hypothetical protein JW929_15840 [Anaerolineales bacterium]|nr:hypothetical protein [Anaerolineales bacterium]